MNFLADIITFVSGISTDVLFSVIVFAFWISSSFYLGSAFVVNMILSWYVALTIFRNIPLEKLETFPKILVLVLIVGVIYFIIKNIVNVYETYVRKRKILRAVIFALCGTALVFITLIYVIPINEVHVFSPIIFKIFSQKLLVFWLVAPVLALYMAHRV
jgi:hypothetical protein